MAAIPNARIHRSGPLRLHNILWIDFRDVEEDVGAEHMLKVVSDNARKHHIGAFGRRAIIVPGVHDDLLRLAIDAVRKHQIVVHRAHGA